MKRSNSKATVKAFIKYCRLEGRQVVYFKLGPSFYKWAGDKTIRKLSYLSADSIVKDLNLAGITPVFEDEQVLLNGEPAKIIKTPFKVSMAYVEQMKG